MLTKLFAGVGVAAALTGCVDEEQLELSTTSEMLESNRSLPSGVLVPNSLGASTTVSTSPDGRINLENPFFQDLGTNDRRCVSCHLPTAGWGVTPQQMQLIFNHTDGGAFDDGFGLGAVFRTNDGANSPTADVSTLEARRAAYSMLLTRGTIRVGIGIPANAEFELVKVEDPYGHASASELSLFRRPLPSTNLTMIPTVMWDGRVANSADPADPTGNPAPTVKGGLSDQSNGATMGHAQALEAIAVDVRIDIVGFETRLFTAQAVTKDLGNLSAEGAGGGAKALSTQAFVAGRFNLYDAWANSENAARRAVFRGQELFNTRRRTNPATGLLAGTCSTCHSAENSGTNVKGIFFNIGTSDGSRRTADQPLYTLKRISDGTEITTTDPGRALITGKWTDMNRFKVPSMRGLAARAPYFHGGSANTLDEVVDLYEKTLGFTFTASEQADLVAFLSAL